MQRRDTEDFGGILIEAVLELLRMVANAYNEAEVVIVVCICESIPQKIEL